MVDSLQPGYEVVYDIRWGSNSPFDVVLIGLALAAFFAFFAMHVKVATPSWVLGLTGEKWIRRGWWAFAIGTALLTAIVAVIAPIGKLRRQKALETGRCEWKEGIVNAVDPKGPELLVGRQWIHQDRWWRVDHIPVGATVRYCWLGAAEEPLRVEIARPVPAQVARPASD